MTTPNIEGLGTSNSDKEYYQFNFEKLEVHRHVLTLLQRFLSSHDWCYDKRKQNAVSLFLRCDHTKSSLRCIDMRTQNFIFDYIRRITYVSPGISQKT